jgi:hypothetical protein
VDRILMGVGTLRGRRSSTELVSVRKILVKRKIWLKKLSLEIIFLMSKRRVFIKSI